MSVLKKVGIFLAGAGADITKFLGLPFISQLLGALPAKLSQDVTKAVGYVQTGVADFNTIAGIVSLAEAMYQPSNTNPKTGSQKLAAAAPIVQKAVLAWAESNLPGHTKIVTSADLFASHCQAFTSAFADIMNDFGE